MKTVLVVAAHPDDEVLGIGGTAARHAAEGDFVYALILGEGQTSRGAHREDVDSAWWTHFTKIRWKAPKRLGFVRFFCKFSRQPL